MIETTPPSLRRFAKFVAGSTLFLIFAGAMVTSTGSGLAVPDWPLSYGMVMPPMVAGILYEHGHRLIAASVGFLVVIQAIWLQLREPKRFVRILGWTSLGAVIAQGVLGGLTVLFLLPKPVSIGHAGLAEIFLCLNVSIAFFTSRSFERLRQTGDDAAPVRLTRALVAVVYLQILAGALVRHLGAGLAIPDFPLSFGRIVPPMTSVAVAANFVHRTGAAVITLFVIATAVAVIRSHSIALRRLGIGLVAILATQIYAGAKLVWFGAANPGAYHSLAGPIPLRLASITSFHVMTGAATLAVSLLLALTAGTLAPRRQPQRSGAFVASEAAA